MSFTSLDVGLSWEYSMGPASSSSSPGLVIFQQPESKSMSIAMARSSSVPALLVMMLVSISQVY